MSTPNDAALEMARQQAAMKERLDAMYHDLYGNGQPGIIEKWDSRLEQLEKQHQRVIWVLGALALASGGGTVSLQKLIEVLSKVNGGG